MNRKTSSKKSALNSEVGNLSQKNTARLVGLLFILATVTLFIGQAFYSSIISSPDYLEITYPNRMAVVTGLLIEFLGVLGLIFIPILLYPFLKIYNQVMAWGYISLRLFETVLLTLAQITKLSIIGLSQNYLASSGDASYFQNMGDMIQAVLYWADSGGLLYIIVFVLGATILNYGLIKTRLIPRWLSILGLISTLVLLSASLLFYFEVIAAEIAVILMIPLALQELVMAIWLIVKGFNPNPAEINQKERTLELRVEEQ